MRDELKPFFEDWEIKLLELIEEHRNEENIEREKEGFVKE